MSTGYPTRELQELEIPIVDQEECKQKYDPEQITDDMICAGIPYDGKDTCPVSGTVDLAITDSVLGYKSVKVICNVLFKARDHEPVLVERLCKPGRDTYVERVQRPVFGLTAVCTISNLTATPTPITERFIKTPA